MVILTDLRIAGHFENKKKLCLFHIFLNYTNKYFLPLFFILIGSYT